MRDIIGRATVTDTPYGRVAWRSAAIQAGTYYLVGFTQPVSRSAVLAVIARLGWPVERGTLLPAGETARTNWGWRVRDRVPEDDSLESVAAQ